MSGDLTRTACGLYVVDGDPLTWPNFTWTITVVDMPDDQEEFDALALIQLELRAQIGADRRTGDAVAARDVAFAALHVGEVPRVEHPGLGYADPEVPPGVVDAGLLDWTVCGVLRDSWQTVCYQTCADGPLAAYYQAWRRAQTHFGQYMLLAAVHEGRQPAVEVFGYADPWAADAGRMALTAAEWGVR